MRFHDTPRPLLQLITAILLTPRFAFANPNPHPSEQAGFTFNELFARYDCAGTTCGIDGQYCCASGSACVTNAQSIASCTANSGAVTTAVQSGWQYYTTTYVETDLVTMTSVWSTYIGGATPTGASPSCTSSLGQSHCGTICCASDQYCFSEADSQCAAAAGGGSSGYPVTSTNGATAVAPIRPTTSAGIVITATVSPTTTVPFMTPVPTGANVTVTSDQMSGGGGLSGGAIAGIVIGVLAGLLLLGLLCFYCCLKGLLDGCLACFGLGGKRRRRTEVEEYERRSHHTSGGGGRTWYGAARPATRVNRTEKHHEGRNILGVGAGLAALWAILGLKRRRDNKRNSEKYSEYSYSSDYYTSASSASSDDRRTRDTRRSMGRR